MIGCLDNPRFDVQPCSILAGHPKANPAFLDFPPLRSQLAQARSRPSPFTMKVALTTLTLAVLFTTGQCLKCYSGTGSFSSSFSQTECASTQEWCRKTTTGFSIAAVETRGCYTSDSNSVISQSTCQSADIAGVGTETCYCNSDLCNGAQGARPVIGMALALISIGVYFLI